MHIPQFDETFDFSAGTPQSKGRITPRIEADALQQDWDNNYAAFRLALDARITGEKDGRFDQKASGGFVAFWPYLTSSNTIEVNNFNVL